MSGQILHEPQSHDCEGRPHSGDVRVGTLWQCDDCGDIYVSKCGEWGFYWKRLSARQARRKLRKLKIVPAT